MSDTRGAIKVLIVDDIEDNRIILHALCDRIADVTAKEAANGVEACEMAKEWKPDLILMDVMMPLMDGIRATEIIKKETPGVGIFVVTALSDAQTEQTFQKLGVDGYIRKPIDKKTLKVKIESFVRMAQYAKGEKIIPSAKIVLNPFSRNVKRMKTHFEILDENDLVALEFWLHQKQKIRGTMLPVEFDASLEIIIYILMECMKSKQAIPIVVEENDDVLYLTVALPKYSSEGLDYAIDKAKASLSKNFARHGQMYYFALHLIKASQPKEEEAATTSAQIDPEKILKVGEQEEELLRKSSYDTSMSAQEYLAVLPASRLNDLYDLPEYESEWNGAIGDLEVSITTESIERLARAISEYSAVVNDLCEFEALGYGLNTLATLLRTASEAKISANSEELLIYLRATLKDLMNWRTTIFVERNVSNIRYLDASLFSSFVQLDAILSDKVVAHSDSEIEFF